MQGWIGRFEEAGEKGGECDSRSLLMTPGRYEKGVSTHGKWWQVTFVHLLLIAMGGIPAEKFGKKLYGSWDRARNG